MVHGLAKHQFFTAHDIAIKRIIPIDAEAHAGLMPRCDHTNITSIFKKIRLSRIGRGCCAMCRMWI
jgi:hypothetical protein